MLVRQPEAAILSRVLDTLPGPALIVDRRHRVRAVNGAFQRGVPGNGDPVGRHCYELLKGRGSRCPTAARDCPLERCFGTARVVPAEHPRATAAGVLRERLLVRPLLGNDGSVAACLGTLGPAAPEAAVDGRGEETCRAAVRALHHAIELVAPLGTPVLVVGEPGTGKSSVAREIHRVSGRSGPFEERSACELDPAVVRAAIEAAAGGTLYVADVDAIDPATRAVLARALEEPGLVRIIAGSEHEPSVLRRRLPGELVTRLAASVIRTVPLRERRAEFQEIVALLLRGAEGQARVVAPDALHRLWKHPFDGNLDELAQALRYASLVARGPIIRACDLPPWVAATAAGAASRRRGRTRTGSRGR